MSAFNCEIHGASDEVECGHCARLDFKGMREFQTKFMESDLKCRDLEAKLALCVKILDNAENVMDLFAFGDFGDPTNTVLLRNQENFREFIKPVRETLRTLTPKAE